MSSTDELIVAAKRGDKDEVLGCLERGANIEGTDDERGQTALFWAIGNKHGDVAITLLEKGADANARSRWFSSTPLITASQNGLTDVVSLLLVKGARINECNSAGEAALMYASDKGHKNIVQKLIEHGAKVNARGFQNRTSLHWASLYNHHEVARVLLENGADINAVNDSGHTALDLAKKRNHLETVNIITNHINNDIGKSTEIRQLMTTLKARVDGIEDSRKRVEEEQIKTMTERLNQLENAIRIKDEQIKELTETQNQWKEDKVLTYGKIVLLADRVKQLGDVIQVKEKQITSLTKSLNDCNENVKMIEKKLTEMKTLGGGENILNGTLGSLYSKIGSAYNELSLIARNSAPSNIPTENQPQNPDEGSLLVQLQSKLNEAERAKSSNNSEIVQGKPEERSRIQEVKRNPGARSRRFIQRQDLHQPETGILKHIIGQETAGAWYQGTRQVPRKSRQNRKTRSDDIDCPNFCVNESWD